VSTMTTRPATTSDAVPTPGALVTVRGQKWVVSDVDRADADGGTGSTLVTLQSVEDGRYDDALEVIWEVEPGRAVLPAGDLPPVAAGGFDHPEQLAAFLDAVRWSAVTSADVKTLQSPFRSGVAIEDYQLEPVARALDAPRVNLLLADDVGLGKTIEAGLVALELLLRHRGKRVMVVCPAGLTTKWRDEMAEKFGLHFTVIDSARCALVRQMHGSAANPFQVYPLTIVSLPWLRGQKAQRLLAEVLPPGGPRERRVFDLLILDEAHHVAPGAPKQAYAVDSQQTKLIRWLAPHFTHRLFLSATPHNGYLESFTALLEIVDDQRFARGVKPADADRDEAVVRRLKQNIREADGSPRFRRRVSSAIPVRYPQEERDVHALLEQFARLRRQRAGRQSARRGGHKAADLVTLLLKKRLFSSPAAFARTLSVLSVPQTGADALAALVEKHWEHLSKLPARELLTFYWSMPNPIVHEFADWPDLDDIWTAMRAHRARLATDPDGGAAVNDLRTPEWQIFTAAKAPDPNPGFTLRRDLDGIPQELAGIYSDVVQVERLREVRALVGFTRLDSPDPQDPDLIVTAPLSHAEATWVPASEVRGEGAFFRLPEDLLRAWERRVAGSAAITR
jgi:hypothetical protein